MKGPICSMILACSLGIVTAHAQTSDSDKEFLTKASQSDFTEIKFSQLALQKGSSPDVKAFAQRMVEDHQRLEAEMKPLADKAGITPVMELDAEHQQKYDALDKLSGMEFDKTYMTGMDQDHHIALDLFTTQEKSATDSALKSKVARGKKVIEMHTAMADKAVKKMSTMPSSASPTSM